LSVRIRVRLFASLREAAGRGEVHLELAPGSTPEDAWSRLVAQHPALAARRGSLTAAVNRRYAEFQAVLADGDELVFIPPVSGG
jgi:molybdopterin synthase sulfur carrier subunit